MKAFILQQLVSTVLPVIVRSVYAALREYADKTETDLDNKILDALATAFNGEIRQIRKEVKVVSSK